MAKSKTQDGEVLLMDKAKVPAKYIEVPAKVVDQALLQPRREKKPLSEKQKENLQRLIELNKKRREEKLAAMRVNVDELGDIPEDKVVVKVVKKVGRPRTNPVRKAKQASSESEHEVVEEEPVLPPPQPKAPKAPRQPRQPKPQPEPEPESEPSPPKVRKARPAPTPKPKPKPVRRSYYSETSETSGVDADSDSESEDEEVVKHKVQKYVEKTKARMEALRQIEQQLKPTNKYSGMSIF